MRPVLGMWLEELRIIEDGFPMWFLGACMPVYRGREDDGEGWSVVAVDGGGRRMTWARAR